MLNERSRRVLNDMKEQLVKKLARLPTDPNLSPEERQAEIVDTAYRLSLHEEFVRAIDAANIGC